MKIKRVTYTKKFVKSVSKLSKKNQKKLLELEKVLMINPGDPRLRTHKLHGRMDGKLAFSITHSIRVVFQYLSETQVVFLDIGTHEVYK